MTEQDQKQNNETIEVTKDEARQGETSGHVRTILIVSLVLAVIALGVIVF